MYTDELGKLKKIEAIQKKIVRKLSKNNLVKLNDIQLKEVIDHLTKVEEELGLVLTIIKGTNNK